MRLLDQGETYFPGGLSSNRINGLCSHVHGYHLIRPLVPAADTRANICNGSNLLKSRRSVSNHVAQLQKWRISTTLLEQHARDSGCGGGEGWSVSYTRICTDSLSLIQRLCECSGGPRPLAPYGIVRGSLGIEPLPINKRDWPGSQQLLLLCVMDHPAHSNNKDATATMTHFSCSTKRPILSLRKSILWFSSVCLCPTFTYVRIHYRPQPVS